MSYSIQGFLQTPAPWIDQTIGAMTNPQATVGNAPTTTNPQVPSGGAINANLGQWILTGGAGSLTTNMGATGDAATGFEFQQVCTAGTNNGFGPAFGAVGRYLTPPVGTLVNLMPVNWQMVRLEVFGLHWDVVPTGTQCGKDSGIVWLSNGMANGCIYDISQANNGGQNVGWGLIYNTTSAQLQFYAKQVSGNGVLATVIQNIGNPANGVNKPFYVDFRWLAPTASVAATINLFIDKTQVPLTATQSSWAAGTLLPAPNAGATAISGYLPCIANNTPTADTVNPNLHFYGARLRIGSIAACTLENQF